MGYLLYMLTWCYYEGILSLQYINNNLFCLMVFNTTFNNISVISWRSVLLVEETGGTGENHRIKLYTSPWSQFEFTTSVVIGTECIGSCKSNYHMITATMAPRSMFWCRNTSRPFAHLRLLILKLYVLTGGCFPLRRANFNGNKNIFPKICSKF